MNTFITVWIISVLLSFFVSGILYAFNVVDGKFVVFCTAAPPVLIVAIITFIAFSLINYVLNIKTKNMDVFNNVKEAFFTFLSLNCLSSYVNCLFMISTFLKGL